MTSFVIHPFAYMDGTLHEYMHLKPEDAKQVVHNLVKEVKRYGGDFVFIWHNETIGDYAKWKGWKAIFEYTLDISKTNE
jgi:predicted SpoU family rRNA methylase